MYIDLSLSTHFTSIMTDTEFRFEKKTFNTISKPQFDILRGTYPKGWRGWILKAVCYNMSCNIYKRVRVATLLRPHQHLLLSTTTNKTSHANK